MRNYSLIGAKSWQASLTCVTQGVTSHTFRYVKLKGSICLLVKLADTAFWLCTAALSQVEQY